MPLSPCTRLGPYEIVAPLGARVSLLLPMLLALAAVTAAAPPARRVLPSDLPLDSAGPDSFVTTFETTKGPVVMKSCRAWSPLGVDRLYHLVRGGYYNGLTIYRVGETKTVAGGRVVQFGQSGDTTMIRAWDGATIADEPVVRTHRAGAVSFARGGPHTRGVELAINTNEIAALDTVRYEGVTGFPVVAEIVEGLDVLRRLNGRYGNAPIENDLLSILGGEYLARVFPGLDRVLRARVTREWGTLGPTPTGPHANLARRIDRLLDQPPFDRATWGVLVQDATGRVVYERNADKLMVPASNNKLLVSSAALALLGPDHRIETSVYGSGPLERGVLRGDLVVYGRGDPTFSAHCYGADSLAGIACDSMWTAIDDLADRLVARGVRRVSGAIVGDGSAFEPRLTHDAWEQYDLNWWYAAPVSGLGFNDGCVDLTETPGAAAGAPAIVTFGPELKSFTFENRSRTTAAGTPRTLEFYRQPGTMSIWAEGDEPIGDGVTKEYFALPDPNLYFAQALRARLAQRGVTIDGPTRSTLDSLRYREARQGTALATHVSRPVADIVFPILNTSQNWFAEMLLKALGRKFGGAGSWAEGVKVERRFLIDEVGVDSTAFATVDGSGLAKGNLISARALTQLLAFARAHRGGDAFLRAMPRSGRPGSLRKRFVGTPLDGRVLAKTGSVERVHSLSGYVERPSGGAWVFSILVNNYAGPADPMLARIDSVVVETTR